MFKHIYATFLSLSLLLFAIACSESANLTGASITGIPDNSTSNIPGNPGSGGGTISGPTDNGTHNGQEDIPPVIGNAPDDQTPDSSVNSDFSNPINMIGRYKINAVRIVNPDGITTLETTAANGDLKGAFAVSPQVSSTISIDIGVKLQFHPDLVKKHELNESIAYVNKKFNKPVDATGMNFDKIFKDLGAVIDGKTIYFTLTPPDMPLGNGFSISLTLEKVSNKADFKLVNDPRKYWVTGNEPEEPVEPENPGTDDNGTVTPEPEEPEIPTEGVITNIDLNNLPTLTGHYKITRFITLASGVTVDSKDLPRMQGELWLKNVENSLEGLSKMQMDADVPGMTPNDKYNYTVYNPFTFNGSNLVSTTPDEYKYSSAVITKTGDTQIQISQNLKKDVVILGKVDVQVTVIATKISDTPKTIVDCGYWDTDTVKACKEDGSASVTNIDSANPETFVGSYKLMNYGMEYQRPAGGQYEQIWSEVRVFDGILYEGKLLVEKWQGELSLKKTADDKYAVDFKAQVDVPYQTQKEYLWGDFNDPRWRFFQETDTQDYSVTTTPNKNELAIKVKRTLSYRYWGVQHNVETYISFIVQKQSDEPQEVTNDKYWETSEPAIIVPDMSDPRTLTGHYKMTNMGHAYSRPNSVGSTWEDNWATNPTVMTNLQGELSFIYNGTDIKTSNIHAKYQIDSTMYIYYSDGMLVRTDFSDPRWKFYNEEFNNNYSVELEGNNIKVCTTRQFEYRFWKVEWLAWKNHWETRKPDVNVCFIGEKVADEPQEIDGNKYR